MSNLEHLIENGIYAIENLEFDEWEKHMSQDLNWEGNEHITLDNLWTICQYVVYTYKPCLIYDIEEKYGVIINV